MYRNYFKKPSLILALMVIFLLFAEESIAAIFIPRAATSYKIYKYEESDMSIEDNFLSLGIGTTMVVSDRFFMDVSSDFSVTEIKDTVKVTDDFGLELPVEFNVDRIDLAASFGYMLYDELSVFAGYKYGKTDGNGKFDFSVYETILEGNNFDADYSFSFVSHGPFIGQAYAMPVGETGTLSFNVALGYMYGDQETKWVLKRIDPEGVEENFGGKTTNDEIAYGFSLGVRWKQSVSETLSYSVGLSTQRYDYSGTKAGVIETIYGFNAKLSYLF